MTSRENLSGSRTAACSTLPHPIEAPMASTAPAGAEMVEQGQQVVGEGGVGVLGRRRPARGPSVRPRVVADQSTTRTQDGRPVEEAHSVLDGLADEATVGVHGQRPFAGVVEDQAGSAVDEVPFMDDGSSLWRHGGRSSRSPRRSYDRPARRTAPRHSAPAPAHPTDRPGPADARTRTDLPRPG